MEEIKKKGLEFSQKMSISVLSILLVLSGSVVFGNLTGKDMSNTVIVVTAFIGGFISLVLKTAYENKFKITSNPSIVKEDFSLNGVVDEKTMGDIENGNF